jgi:glycosyltransferase involved in cell wall biosynthesis
VITAMAPMAERPLDIFIDVTSDRLLGRRMSAGPVWPHPDRFTVRARRVTCLVAPDSWMTPSKQAVPVGWTVVASTSPIEACSQAMNRAAADGASLLLLLGPVEASDEAVFAMRQTLMRDPMYGCAAARTRCASACCVRRQSRNGLEPGEWIPRRTLAEVSEAELSSELCESSLLFRPETVAEFGPLDGRFSSLAGAILHYLSRARRCGYRTVLANRAVIAVSGLACEDGQAAGGGIPHSDQTLLRRLTPELDRAWGEFRTAANERFEHLSAHVHRANTSCTHPSVVLDVRNVTAVHNGTSQAVLGCVDALYRSSPSWDVTVVAAPSAIQFHALTKSWPHWTLTTSVPSRPSAVALRLSQPWHIQEMVDLHRTALFNVYFMLDTISWDIVYSLSDGLDGTWSFLADHADGLLFDSAFTERRFLERFVTAKHVRRAVCHYPFDPAAYADPRLKESRTADYVLVVGNELDHKDAVRTIELLSAAFPFRQLVSLGPSLSVTPQLRVYRSGSISEKDVMRLYAEAAFVVFPSFYEGFGFPIVTALAYGKTLVARKSELLDEIAARCSTGRIISYTRRDQLVEILGRLLHGKPIPEVPLGTAVADVSRQWSDVARDITAFVNDIIAQRAHSAWLTREHAINQIVAFSS